MFEIWGKKLTKPYCLKLSYLLSTLRQCWIFSPFLPGSALGWQQLPHLGSPFFFVCRQQYSPQYLAAFRATAGFINNSGWVFGMAAVVVACSSCAILLLAGASSCQNMSWVVLPPNLKTRVASFNHMSTTFPQTSARAVQARLSTFLFLFVRLSPFSLLLSGYPLFDALVCLFVWPSCLWSAKKKSAEQDVAPLSNWNSDDQPG